MKSGRRRARRSLPEDGWEYRRRSEACGAARNLHCDLRLELDGVLLSWAIPKESSPTQAEKRLAMIVWNENCEVALDVSLPVGPSLGHEAPPAWFD